MTLIPIRRNSKARPRRTLPLQIATTVTLSTKLRTLARGPEKTRNRPLVRRESSTSSRNDLRSLTTRKLVKKSNQQSRTRERRLKIQKRETMLPLLSAELCQMRAMKRTCISQVQRSRCQKLKLPKKNETTIKID